MTTAPKGRNVISLLDVLTAFSEQPATFGNAVVIKSLRFTSARVPARLAAIDEAHKLGMTRIIRYAGSWCGSYGVYGADGEDLIEWAAGEKYYDALALSPLGIETLERLRFDVRSRAGRDFGNALLAEMDGAA